MNTEGCDVKPRLFVILALLAVSVAARLIPYVLAQFGMALEPGSTTYPWNLSPFLPICLFGGAMFARARMAYLVPFAAWLLGDLGIWALTGRSDWAFYAHQPVIYLSFALVAFIGFALRRERSWKRVAGAGLGASLGFFVLSNFGVWAFGGGAIYPLNFAGLVECYVMAIPYLRNTLVSMAVFLPVLFSRVTLTRPTSAPHYGFAASHT